MPRLLLATAALLAVAACSDPDAVLDADAGVLFDLGPPAPVDAGAEDAGPDGGVDTGAPDLGPPPPPSFCEALGLPERPFQPGAGGFAFGDVAGDFTATMIDGSTWTFSEAWEGCETALFVGYFPAARQNPLQPTVFEQIWNSPVEPLVETPVNHHFFFVSWEAQEGFRATRVSTVRDRIEAALAAAGLSDEALELQRRRFHYVASGPREIEGSVGAWFRDYWDYYRDPSNAVDLGDRGPARAPFPFAVGIDRSQRWDAVGSLSEFVGGPSTLRMLSFLPGFYDHKAALGARVAAEEGVTEVVLLDEEVTDRIFTPEVELPTGPALAAADTLEVDVQVRCRARNVFACSEWDRIARIEVCLDDACESRRELVRWITPYWRRGERRWVMDASALMGLLGDGGPTRFRVEMGPGWERKTPRDVRIALRLSNRARGERATGALRAFTGGRFEVNEERDYNAREPVRFTPPATARRVEVVYILSGHGQTQGNNCAEWCDHRHVFTVNGSALPEVRHEGTIGSVEGCGSASVLGVPPGQYGNWAPERAYWCPGLPVEHRRIDITDRVELGAENTLEYAGNFAGRAPAGGNISLSVYVTWTE